MKAITNMTSSPIDNVLLQGTLKGLCAYGSLCVSLKCMST